jgi:xylan 1,4-beta-xylosidase
MNEAPHFTSDLSHPAKPLPHFWEHTVGSDHAPVALRSDWQSQLLRCHRELGFRYVRFHGILSDDLGTLTLDRDGLRYSFFNADQVTDFVLSIGMRPFVELSFMPTALASGETTVFRYRGNVTPPRSEGQWHDLIRRFVAHFAHRYGLAELRQWFFEVWNEPNLKAFWTGSQENYFELYGGAAHAIKAVDEHLSVGGPATAANEWIPDFLDFCHRSGTPVDFVSTHHYPTDGLGLEGDDAITRLSFGRRSALRAQARQARQEAGDRPLYYTEWNTSSSLGDPLHDEPYAAAFVVKTVLEAHGLVAGYSFWTFSDLFEEDCFPSMPFHGGFGLLNLHGIPKPAYHAYALLHRLGSERLDVQGRHETVDAWVVKGEEGTCVLLANHALPGQPIATEPVRVTLKGVSDPRSVELERVDADHGNPRRIWEEMGEPEYLTSSQVGTLKGASGIEKEKLSFRQVPGGIEMEIALPPHGVAAVTVR